MASQNDLATGIVLKADIPFGIEMDCLLSLKIFSISYVAVK